MPQLSMLRKYEEDGVVYAVKHRRSHTGRLIVGERRMVRRCKSLEKYVNR